MVTAVFTLGLITCILTPGRELLAQQTSDLPATPGAATGGEENASIPVASVNSPGTLTFGERLKIYGRSFTKPESLIGPVLGAGVGQLRDTPPEWGQGAEGFGQRLASGYGRSVIARSIAFGVAAADHEDSRFVPSNESGFGGVPGTPSWEPLFRARGTAAQCQPFRGSPVSTALRLSPTPGSLRAKPTRCTLWNGVRQRYCRVSGGTYSRNSGRIFAGPFVTNTIKLKFGFRWSERS
jgi:hypothetical protein